jgi:hypothetical protein
MDLVSAWLKRSNFTGVIKLLLQVLLMEIIDYVLDFLLVKQLKFFGKINATTVQIVPSQQYLEIHRLGIILYWVMIQHKPLHQIE